MFGLTGAVNLSLLAYINEEKLYRLGSSYLKPVYHFYSKLFLPFNQNRINRLNKYEQFKTAQKQIVNNRFTALRSTFPYKSSQLGGRFSRRISTTQEATYPQETWTTSMTMMEHQESRGQRVHVTTPHIYVSHHCWQRCTMFCTYYVWAFAARRLIYKLCFRNESIKSWA